MKKHILTILSVFTLFAGGKDKVSTSGALLLNLNVDPRGVYMNGAHASSVTGLAALQYNAAGLSYLSGYEVVFNSATYLADLKLTEVGFAIPFENSGMAIRYKSLSSGNEEVTTADQVDGTGDFWSYTASEFNLSWAKKFTEKVSFGATFKYYEEGVSATSGSAWGIDMGIQYRTKTGFSLGLALKNVGGDLTFATKDNVYKGTDNQSPHDRRLQSTVLPSQFEMSVNYSYDIDETMNFIAGAKYVNANQGIDQMNFAGEFNYDETFVAGLSYNNYGEEYESVFTGMAFGFGLMFNMGEESKIKFSYSIKTSDNDNFSSPSYFGISLKF